MMSWLGQPLSFSITFRMISASKICGGSSIYKWGCVSDIFIPPKRDKNGNRFGFVRMKGACNAKEPEAQLDKIWIGSQCNQV